MSIIRLPLEGASNTRDIGGYACENNKMFKWKKVLRSDCMSQLTEKDKDFLINNYKVKKVIDLRSEGELTKLPNALATDDRVEYINVSLADDVDPNKPLDVTMLSDKFLRDFYFNLIDNKKENLKKVLQEISNLNDNESVIFHCTAGKDRTGVLAMLLLGICGVAKQDIATNYMQSSTNLKYNEKFSEGMKSLMKKFEDHLGENAVQKLTSSKEEDIEDTYDKLIGEYETFENYFLHIGLTTEEINKLKNILTKNID